MKKYCFTFGFGQPLQGHYHIIQAKNSEEARKKMFERFGNKWSMQYDSEEAAGVEEYNLRKII